MARPKSFGEFLALQMSDKAAYDFFNAKLKFTDAEITDVTAFVASFIIHTTDPSGTAKQKDYVVDYLCHSFVSATVQD